MKLRYILMLAIYIIVFTGCTNDGTTTTSAVDCTALTTTMTSEAESFAAMFGAVMTGDDQDNPYAHSFFLLA